MVFRWGMGDDVQGGVWVMMFRWGMGDDVPLVPQVKSRDREFENIPHLVDHFMNLKTPLIIGDSEVFLKRPVVNSFQNT